VHRRNYETDLSDEEWQVVRALVEVPQQGPGPRRSVNLREVVNALLYKQRTGCQWRMLPHDLPPRSTVSGYYQRWSKTGVLEQVYLALRQQIRDGDVYTALPGSSTLNQAELAPVQRASRQRQVFAEQMS
jgi:putative transposase